MSKFKLALGDSIPRISLQNQRGEWVDLSVGNAPKVIYFYPKDDTPGCIAEACSFRDKYADFEQIGAIVIGISRDSLKSHANFAKRYRLSFDLLSDQDGKAERAFGVPRNLLGLLPGRVTFVFNSQGKLIHQFNSALMARKHITESLSALQQSYKP